MFSVIFALVATIIAVLTYKRASKTFLQPIRTEVIKKQSTLLTELLDLISTNKTIDDGLDYIGIASLNVFMILNDYGFLFNNRDKIMDHCKQITSGWIPCGDSNVIDDVQIVGMFDKLEKEPACTLDLSKERYEHAKQGIIVIDKIYFTKRHFDYIKQLSYYLDTPFLPDNIQKILRKIILDISSNLTSKIKNILTIFMLKFSEAYFKEGKCLPVQPVGVYNEFNHDRIHHNIDLQLLKKEIRDYLKINEKW